MVWATIYIYIYIYICIENFCVHTWVYIHLARPPSQDLPGKAFRRQKAQILDLDSLVQRTYQMCLKFQQNYQILGSWLSLHKSLCITLTKWLSNSKGNSQIVGAKLLQHWFILSLPKELRLEGGFQNPLPHSPFSQHWCDLYTLFTTCASISQQNFQVLGFWLSRWKFLPGFFCINPWRLQFKIKGSFWDHGFYLVLVCRSLINMGSSWSLIKRGSTLRIGSPSSWEFSDAGLRSFQIWAGDLKSKPGFSFRRHRLSCCKHFTECISKSTCIFISGCWCSFL